MDDQRPCRRVFILSGGELGPPGRLREALAETPAAVICADGGARHLAATGFTPTLIVGDMDSLARGMQEGYRQGGCRIVAHPGRKDETDTELALQEAFALDPGEIWIWAALGGRVDHALANISLLWQGIQRGVAMKLVDGWCEVFLITKATVIAGGRGQTVSLLPFAGEVRGVTLSGFEYPLCDAVMAPGSPYGVSNRLAGERGEVTLSSGCLLAVRYFQPGVFPGEERG